MPRVLLQFHHPLNRTHRYAESKASEVSSGECEYVRNDDISRHIALVSVSKVGFQIHPCPTAAYAQLAIEVAFATPSNYPIDLKLLINDNAIHKLEKIGRQQKLCWENVNPMCVLFYFGDEPAYG
jgi:hypothetical protein